MDKDMGMNRNSEILSRLAIYIVLLGWIMLGLYIAALIGEYKGVDSAILRHFLSTEESGIRFRALMLLAPFILTVIGYLVNERAELFKKRVFAEIELRSLFDGLIVAFANAIDAKSHWTKGHSERVTNYVVLIAREMNLGEKDIKILRTAAILHDIGKIGTYDMILEKTDKLTEEEFALIKKHPDKGADILGHIKQLHDVIPVIRHHHERLDGNGYPNRLTGEDIPLLARIICVADSFDAMTAERPYKKALDKDKAVLELKRCSGTQFDPRAVEAFLRIIS